MKRLSISLIFCLLATACSQEFAEIPLSQESIDFIDMLQHETDADSQLEIARIKFTHNSIDEADELLHALVKVHPEHWEAQAWYGANNCKLAARKGPWLMGFDKLYGVWNCLNQVQTAYDHASDNFTIQMVLVNTFAEVNMFGSLDKAWDVLGTILSQIEDRPEHFPPTEQVAAFEAAINVAQNMQNPADLVKSYLDKIIQLNTSKESVARAQIILNELTVQ